MKVMVPGILTRVVEAGFFAAQRIGYRFTGRLTQGAGYTGQRQIPGDTFAPSRDRNDMIYMKHGFLTLLG